MRDSYHADSPTVLKKGVSKQIELPFIKRVMPKDYNMFTTVSFVEQTFDCSFTPALVSFGSHCSLLLRGTMLVIFDGYKVISPPSEFKRSDFL
jgi:hypothetical protein